MSTLMKIIGLALGLVGVLMFFLLPPLGCFSIFLGMLFFMVAAGAERRAEEERRHQQALYVQQQQFHAMQQAAQAQSYQAQMQFAQMQQQINQQQQQRPSQQVLIAAPTGDVRAQLELAREMINDKNYTGAKKLLRTINHPKATEWLQKLDNMSV